MDSLQAIIVPYIFTGRITEDDQLMSALNADNQILITKNSLIRERPEINQKVFAVLKEQESQKLFS
jgi:hypothetical protein